MRRENNQSIGAAFEYVDMVLNSRSLRNPPQAGELGNFGPAQFQHAEKEIKSWKGYAPTPLRSLKKRAEMLGVAELYFKDESGRFGLGSFKALGGAYAVSQLAARLSGQKLIVVSATDGNHGRSVAWGARMFGFPCIIYVHATVSEARVQAIEAYGAEVRRVAGNYDDSVMQAAADAQANGWQVVSDTSYEGYRDVPRDVMLGYTILLGEIMDELDSLPTHVFVQGGVGGLAATVSAYFSAIAGAARPYLVVVEPDQADCLLRSARSGQCETVPGKLNTVMAGLACGKPSEMAWEILRDTADAFISIRDVAALSAMASLASPSNGDRPVVSGESGVAGLAGLHALAWDVIGRRRIGLSAKSRVLVIGTEGDTDPEFYKSVVSMSAEDVLRNVARPSA